MRGFCAQDGEFATPVASHGQDPVRRNAIAGREARCKVLGKIDGDARQLASVRSGDAVTLTLE